MNLSVVKASAVEESAEPAGIPTSGSLPAAPISPEIYRQIYVSLDLPVDTGPVIGITSAIAGEGRTTVALGLAHTLATDLDTTVILVDAHLDRPSLHERLGITASRGLAEVLQGETSAEEVISQVTQRLFVITSGKVRNDSARLLRQLSDYDPFQSLRQLGAVTVLDLPPILNHSYSALAASVADAVVLVVRAGATPVQMVHEAISRLRDRPLQGVVFNGEQPARSPQRPRRQQ